MSFKDPNKLVHSIILPIINVTVSDSIPFEGKSFLRCILSRDGPKGDQYIPRMRRIKEYTKKQTIKKELNKKMSLST